MADAPAQTINERGKLVAEQLRFELDIVRQAEGDYTAVAIANAYLYEALNFVYAITGVGGANAALEMFRAELVRRHPILDAVPATQVRQ